jgi:hypothetical protein
LSKIFKYTIAIAFPVWRNVGARILGEAAAPKASVLEMVETSFQYEENVIRRGKMRVTF